jgi:hypothetical protein
MGAGHGCRAWVPGMAAGHGCQEWLPGMARLPGKARAHDFLKKGVKNKKKIF